MGLSMSVLRKPPKIGPLTWWAPCQCTRNHTLTWGCPYKCLESYPKLFQWHGGPHVNAFGNLSIDMGSSMSVHQNSTHWHGKSHVSCSIGPDSHHRIPGTSRGIHLIVYFLVFGLWSTDMVYSVWYMVYGIWYKEVYFASTRSTPGGSTDFISSYCVLSMLSLSN